MSDRSRLAELFRLHKSLPFPTESGWDELDAIRADLVLYDNDVAGAVSWALAGQSSVDPRLVEQGKALRRSIEALMENGDPDVRESATAYNAHVERLLELLAETR